MNQGKVYWITGLSGAGKTTIGTLLHGNMHETVGNLVLLDGDQLREVIQNKDYSYEGRKQVAYQYSKLCRMLALQGINVIICTISMYDEVREWNKKNIENYCEIYLKVSIEELIRRDQKKLYSSALDKKASNVMGVDLAFEEPKWPDIVIENDGTKDIGDVYKELIYKINIWKEKVNELRGESKIKEGK